MIRSNPYGPPETVRKIIAANWTGLSFLPAIDIRGKNKNESLVLSQSALAKYTPVTAILIGLFDFETAVDT